MLLYQSLIPPIMLGAVVALAAVWLAVVYERLWIAWAGAALELPIFLWMVWKRIDWGNDYYIVTNQRIVHLEKVVGIYDSRVEAPLASIMSVDVGTDDPIQRAFDMGDVVVRTFSGPITLKSVARPKVLEAAITEYWYRTRVRERETEAAQLRQALRERILHGAPDVKLPTRRAAAAAAKVEPALQRLGKFFSFRLRFEQGKSIVYRKHWYMLVARVWRPTLGLLLVVALATVAAAGLLPAALPLAAVLLVAGVLLVPLAGWWLYEYIDWRNDIYMVTDDQIFDITKKPLGAETKKSAPLGNVLSLKYERPGLLSVVLNFGTVVAQVAGTEFRFEGVFDPVSVQNDVNRRMEALSNKKAAAENARIGAAVIDALGIYHELVPEIDADGQERKV
jgi:hypothetical protein